MTYVRGQRLIPVVVSIGTSSLRAEVPYGAPAEATQCLMNHLKVHALAYIKAEPHAPLSVAIDGEQLGPQASALWVKNGWLH